MAEGDFIDIIEDDIEAGWTWLKTEAVSLYDAVSPLWAVPLKAFESGVIQRLWGVAVAVVQKLLSATSLADLETGLLNIASRLGGGLLEAAKTLGSALLQATLGILQAKAQPAA